MHPEILPVSLEKKATVIDNIRNFTIPSLITHNYPSKKILRILHRAGTWYAKCNAWERSLVADGYTAFYGGINPQIHRITLEEELTKLTQNPEKFSSYGYYARGNYRILGHFAPNPEIASFIPDTANRFTGALPVSTRDYHVLESPVYYPPVFNIHLLMESLCNNFDSLLEKSDDIEKTAQSIATFYFWGIAMIHPFIGGNHRAFDRFIEYAFAKKGFTIATPSDSTLNIPNCDPFNTAIYKERQKILAGAGLLGCQFDMRGFKDVNKWLVYQRQLNQELQSHLNNSSLQTGEMIQAMLDWS